MSDNGMTGGGSGRPGQDLAPAIRFFNGNQTGLKGSTDEGSVRVPFFIRWDNHIQPGRDISTIAAHIDILPTLAALAGAQLPPNQVEGSQPLAADRRLATGLARSILLSHTWPVGARSM